MTRYAPMGADRGQTTIEWLGIAAVIIGVLAAVLTADLGSGVADAVVDLVCRASGGCADGGTAAGHPAVADGVAADGTGDGGPADGPADVAARAGDAAHASEPVQTGTGLGDDTLTGEELDAIRAALATGEDAAIHDALDDLSPEEIAQLVDVAGDEVALVDGVPQDIRVAANAQLIQDHIDAMQAAIDQLSPDGPLDRVRDALADADDWIGDRLSPSHHLEGSANEAIFGTPDAHTDSERIALLEERIETYEQWITEGRQIIRFEPAEDIVNGDAIVVEVFGDLDSAANVGIIIPGVWNDDDNYDDLFRPQVQQILDGVAPETALVAHLGYDTPESLVSVATATADRAQGGAASLGSFIDSLDADGTDRLVTVVGHSYGTRAAVEATRSGTDADQLVILGSPGVGVSTAGQTGVPAEHVYIATNDDDPISYVPNVDIFGLGHGRDPAAEDFGGSLLDGDGVLHPGYFDPETNVGGSVAAIVDGRREDATVIADRGAGVP